MLVNTARGSIVDETALAEAVATGRLLGVATDVLDGEERGDLQCNPLLSCARAGHNVLITPHIGGATREAIRQTETAVVKHLATLLSPIALTGPKFRLKTTLSPSPDADSVRRVKKRGLECKKD